MNSDSFFEYLVPALFFVFYIVTKILEARNKKASPRDIPEEAEPSAIDEVRREIQKKILERQKQGLPQRPQTMPEADWAHEPKMDMRPQAPKPRPAQKNPSPQEDYLVRLKQEKARIDASNKEAQRIRQTLKKKPSLTTRPKRMHGTSTGLKETLRNPVQARKAYLYHEIFGAPIALRKREGMLPSWKL